MNYKVNLENIEINVPQINADVKIGKLAVEVTDLNISEVMEAMMQLLRLITDIRKAIEIPLQPANITIEEDDDDLDDEDMWDSDSDDNSDKDNTMFYALCDVTGIHPSEFVQVGPDRWATKAREFRVVPVEARYPHGRSEIVLAEHRSYRIHLIGSDDESRAYAESVIADWNHRMGLRPGVR